MVCFRKTIKVGITVATAEAFNTAKSFTGIVNEANKSFRIMKGVGTMANNINKNAIGSTLPTSTITDAIQPSKSMF